MTYTGDAPLQGAPYQLIIEIIQENRASKTSDLLPKVISSFITRSNLNLVAFIVDYDQLQEIKALTRELAYTSLLYNHLQKRLDPLNTFNLKNLLLKHEKALKQGLSSLVLCQNNSWYFSHPIEMMKAKTENLEFLQLYAQLSFNQGNFWIYLLDTRLLQTDILIIEKEAKFKEEMKPLIQSA